MSSLIKAIKSPFTRGNSLSGILDYETLKTYNKENLCNIYVTGDEGSGISGIVDPEGSSMFSVSATYKPLIDQSRFLNNVQDVVNVGSAAWQQPQVMINSLRLSEKSFKGFEASNGFSVKLSVPVMCQNDNPAQIAYTIMSYACGIRAGGSGGSYSGNTEQKIKAFGRDVNAEFILYAPNRYHIEYKGGVGGESDIPHNSTTISVGTRYLYSNVLVKQVDAKFSDTVYYDGKPTLLDIFVKFEYWRQMDLETFASFLRINNWR